MITPANIPPESGDTPGRGTRILPSGVSQLAGFCFLLNSYIIKLGWLAKNYKPIPEKLILTAKTMADNPQDDNFFQLHLFDFDMDDKTPNDSFTITNEIRDKLLVTLLGLATVKGVGFRTLCHMFDTGLLHQIWDLELNEVVEKLAELPGKPSVPGKLIYEEKQGLLEIGHSATDDLRNQNVTFVPLGHKDYPETLLSLAEPPRWIFVNGDLDVLRSGAIVAIIGTREASSEGQELAYRCARELVTFNIVVLSGLAKGIDEKAHEGAVDYYGQSIAVLGHGFNNSYAPLNRKLVNKILNTDGAIISEYLPSDPPSRVNYLRRNELQAALAKAVIPIECPRLESGTGATIRRAMRLNKPVVGFFPIGTNEPNLQATRENLHKLGHQVISVSENHSHEFLNYLRKIIPNHFWHATPQSRQDRFFHLIERQVLAAKKKVPIDNEAIDRFVSRLKEKLEN